jgi:ABC-type dipeptide/oligopeptide/nickel transport system permease subunit
MNVRDNVSLTETAEGAFILDQASGECFGLNRLGRDIWQRVAAGGDVEEIATSLAATFPTVPRETIAKDLRQFIVALEERVLVVP